MIKEMSDMGIKDLLKKVKEGFVINEVEKMSVPEFTEAAICRKRILFEGLVQQVGFRFEMQMLAVRLGLTGKAVNQSDGSVLAEVQGTEEKIDYLISMLHQVKRFRIDDCTVSNLPVICDEDRFTCG